VYYSELTDIQDIFPEASKFKVDRVTLVFLKNKNDEVSMALALPVFDESCYNS
jgi:hypothetical protein